MGPTFFSETSITNYQSTLGKFAEGRRFKSRITSNYIHMGGNCTGTGSSTFFGFPPLIIIPPLLLIAMTYMVVLTRRLLLTRNLTVCKVKKKKLNLLFNICVVRYWCEDNSELRFLVILWCPATYSVCWPVTKSSVLEFSRSGQNILHLYLPVE